MEQEKRERLCPYCEAAVDESVLSCCACGKPLRSPDDTSAAAGNAASNVAKSHAGGSATGRAVSYKSMSIIFAR